METEFKLGEIALCGEAMPVDVVAEGDKLPFKNSQYDYVISSHVIEHFFDPVKAIKEWLRVIKKGGYIFIIAPNQHALPIETRPCTTLKEIIARHDGKLKVKDVSMVGGHNVFVSGKEMLERGHYSVWNLPEFLEICDHYKFKVVESLEQDDKVGNGFCVIIQK
jgi:ubiquinone/menaquinone biosynthesis C-methylase UbiE